MILTPRLNYIANHVPNDASFIDIAADHGYLGLELTKRNAKRKKIIISDIAKLPLASAKKNFADEHMEQLVDFRLGSGLRVLKDNEYIDVAIIAGIGGRLMTQILQDNIKKTKQIGTFILQANVGMHIVREWLYEHKFHFLTDDLIYDQGYIYECLIVQPATTYDIQFSTEKKIRLFQFMFGIYLQEQDCSLKKQWLTRYSKHYQNKIKQMDYAIGDKILQKKKLYQQYVEYIEEMLHNVC